MQRPPAATKASSEPMLLQGLLRRVAAAGRHAGDLLAGDRCRAAAPRSARSHGGGPTAGNLGLVAVKLTDGSSWRSSEARAFWIVLAAATAALAALVLPGAPESLRGAAAGELALTLAVVGAGGHIDSDPSRTRSSSSHTLTSTGRPSRAGARLLQAPAPPARASCDGDAFGAARATSW